MSVVVSSHQNSHHNDNWRGGISGGRGGEKCREEGEGVIVSEHMYTVTGTCTLYIYVHVCVHCV